MKRKIFTTKYLSKAKQPQLHLRNCDKLDYSALACKDMKIGTFFKPDKLLPISTINKESIQNAQLTEKTNKLFSVFNFKSSQLTLIKNPSKQKPTQFEKTIEVQKYIEISKKTLLFNDCWINVIYSHLIPSIKRWDKTNFGSKMSTPISIIYYTLTKFILQIKSRMLYIPLQFFNQEEVDNTFIPWFNGFGNIKNIILQYLPSNKEEFEYYSPYWFDMIQEYISNNEKSKALCIVSPKDYRGKIKEIEMICKVLEYNVIRIDENEINRIGKWNNLSEAMKSQRLPCLPEVMNNNLKIVEAIVNNYPSKINKWMENDDLNEKVKRDIIIEDEDGPCSEKNLNTIEKYFLMNTKENTVYKSLQNNWYNVCNKEKTLIWITDSFCNYSIEAEVKYWNSIVAKIKTAKCPIILLSDNVNFMKGKAMNSYIRFNYISESSRNDQSKYVFLISFVIWLHLRYSKWSEIECDDIGEIYEIINKIGSSVKANQVSNETLSRVQALSKTLFMMYHGDIEGVWCKLKDIFNRVITKDVNISLSEIDRKIHWIERELGLVGNEIADFSCYYSTFNCKSNVELFMSNDKMFSTFVEQMEYESWQEYEWSRLVRLSDSWYSKCKGYDKGELCALLNQNHFEITKITPYFSTSLQTTNFINHTTGLSDKTLSYLINQDLLFLRAHEKRHIQRRDIKHYNSSNLLNKKQKYLISKNIDVKTLLQNYFSLHNSLSSASNLNSKHFLDISKLNYYTNYRTNVLNKSFYY